MDSSINLLPLQESNCVKCRRDTDGLVWKTLLKCSEKKNQYFHHQINNETGRITLTQTSSCGLFIDDLRKRQAQAEMNVITVMLNIARLVHFWEVQIDIQKEQTSGLTFIQKGFLIRCSLRSAWRSARTTEASSLDSGAYLCVNASTFSLIAPTYPPCIWRMWGARRGTIVSRCQGSGWKPAALLHRKHRRLQNAVFHI